MVENLIGSCAPGKGEVAESFTRHNEIGADLSYVCRRKKVVDFAGSWAEFCPDSTI